MHPAKGIEFTFKRDFSSDLVIYFYYEHSFR